MVTTTSLTLGESPAKTSSTWKRTSRADSSAASGPTAASTTIPTNRTLLTLMLAQGGGTPQVVATRFPWRQAIATKPSRVHRFTESYLTRHRLYAASSRNPIALLLQILHNELHIRILPRRPELGFGLLGFGLLAL